MWGAETPKDPGEGSNDHLHPNHFSDRSLERWCLGFPVTETIRAILPIPLVVSWFGQNVEEDLGSCLKWGRTTSLAASAGCQQWARWWAEQQGSSGHEVRGQGQRDGGGGTSKTLPRIMESMDKSESKEVALLGTGWGPLSAACLSGA